MRESLIGVVALTIVGRLTIIEKEMSKEIIRKFRSPLNRYRRR